VTAEVRFPPAGSASVHFCPYGTCPNMSHGRPKWRLAMAALRRSALAQIVHRSNFYQLTNLQLDPPEVEAYYSSSQYIDDHHYNCTRLQNQLVSHISYYILEVLIVLNQKALFQCQKCRPFDLLYVCVTSSQHLEGQNNDSQKKMSAQDPNNSQLESAFYVFCFRVGHVKVGSDSKLM